MLWSLQWTHYYPYYYYNYYFSLAKTWYLFLHPAKSWNDLSGWQDVKIQLLTNWLWHVSSPSPPPSPPPPPVLSLHAYWTFFKLRPLIWLIAFVPFDSFSRWSGPLGVQCFRIARGGVGDGGGGLTRWCGSGSETAPTSPSRCSRARLCPFWLVSTQKNNWSFLVVWFTRFGDKWLADS